MAWAYLSRIFSFNSNGRDGLGHPSPKSEAEPPSPSAPSTINQNIEATSSRQSELTAEPPSISAPSTINTNIEVALSRQSELTAEPSSPSAPSTTNQTIEAASPRQSELTPPPPPPITGSNVDHVPARPSDPRIPDSVGDASNLDEFPRSDLVDSAPKVLHEVVEAPDDYLKSPKSPHKSLPIVSNSTIETAVSSNPDSKLSSISPSSITNSSLETALTRQLDSELLLGPLLLPNDIGEDLNNADPALKIPEDFVETVSESHKSYSAEPQSILSSSTHIETVQLRQSMTELAPASVAPITGSNIGHVPARQSDVEIYIDISKCPDKPVEPDLPDPSPNILNDITEALSEPRESHFAQPPPTEAISSRQPDINLRPPSIMVYESPESNLNISQVSLLIRSAREPGNKSALKQVKTFFKKAARTVRKKLTPAQIYVLDNWDSHSSRSRRSSTFSLHSTIYPPSQLAQSSSLTLSSPKIFIDASAYGIGFVFNDRWLAWTLAPNHPNIPVGPDNNIVMSWAELIAVELGLLTLLSSGYKNVTVKVRSDNRGVVNALKMRKWTSKYGLNIILARILHMCDEATLELEADWISTSENPADGPSRGEYPPLDLMLNHSPYIPPHLQGLVNQVELNQIRPAVVSLSRAL